ncbi:DDHD domain [Popillia japonica]|uniref:DDHD domain n=1 Tax=Popillia japonica TaxID=7064 RepID=A0AAW1KS18_POPJA
MHLELKETMAKVGSDLKQKLVDSMKNTWNSLLGWSSTKPPMQPTIAEEVDKVLEQFASKHSGHCETDDQGSSDVAGINLGALNQGRRIDYVLQEAPVEFFNEYLFALSSHVCYWDSEDTVLMIVKEIYNLLNIAPDSQIPQQTMTIERPIASRTPETGANQEIRMGVDPTMPIRRDASVGPPPLSGFVKNSS